MNARTRYIVGLKPGSSVAPDWAQELTGMAGVEVHSASMHRAQISATAEGIEAVRERFANDFHVEEVSPRETQ